MPTTSAHHSRPAARALPAFCAGFAVLLLGGFAARAQAPGTPVGLQCEYLPNPLGLDAPHPRLAWRLADARRGAG